MSSPRLSCAPDFGLVRDMVLHARMTVTKKRASGKVKAGHGGRDSPLFSRTRLRDICRELRGGQPLENCIDRGQNKVTIRSVRAMHE